MAAQNNSKKSYNLFISLTCKKNNIFHLTEGTNLLFSPFAMCLKVLKVELTYISEINIFMCHILLQLLVNLLIYFPTLQKLE